MKTALIVLAGVLLRDLWCWCAAKLFCWRRRRQAKREAAQTTELRALARQYSLKQVTEAERMKQALNPQLLNGRRWIGCRNDKDFLRIMEYLHANFRARGKVIFAADFEEN